MRAILLFLCFLFGRLLLLCSLYFLDAPMGGSFVDNWTRFFPFSIILDIGVFALVCLVFEIVRAQKAAMFFLVFYMLLMGIDDECMRQAGLRFSLQFVSVYNNLNFKIIDWGHVFITVGIIAATIVAYACFIRKFGGKNLEGFRKGILIAILIILSAVGLSSKWWFTPSQNRWARVQPIGWNWCYEIYYKLAYMQKPKNYEKGIELLGGNPKSEYPFWHIENDSLAYSDFKELPLEQKPDIIIFTMETMRGWYSDIRDSATCENLPNLCRFSKQAVFFPQVHSIGYPTVEGIVGIQMGIYSHPRRIFIRDRKYVNSLSLPEILGKAGYYRAYFTASEPTFDNFLPLFRDWFDYWEFSHKNNEDVPLANRIAQWLKEYPADKPLFLNYASTTTHIPFAVPEHSGYKTPENLQDRYKLVLHYADSAVGILLKAIERTERKSIIAIVGDHAYPENGANATEIIDKSRTHIPLWISASALPQGSVDSRIVSQSAVSPTILDILNLKVSNHFVSKSLLSDYNPTVFTFRDNNYAIYNSVLSDIEAKAAMDAWAYVLDKNLLVNPLRIRIYR